jgi:dTDP-4-amino-4,6-dideoxygalactose transaminase
VNDEALFNRAEIAREKGTNRSQFFRGMVDKYSWMDLGSSWLPSEFTAAHLVAALADAEVSQASRMRVWTRYAIELAPWANMQGVQLPIVPAASVHPAHMFYMIMPSLEVRTRLIGHLRERGVQAVFHYLPLHRAPAASRHGRIDDSCPVTDRVSDCLIRLPLFAEMTSDEVAVVVSAVTDFAC